MNQGTMVGFTRRRGLPGGATYPEMKVRYVPLGSPYQYWLTSGDVDTLLQVDSASAATVYLTALPELRPGAAIHIAQWGAGQLTVVSTDPSYILLRTAATAKTRAQFSVISLLKTNSYYNEFLLFGDMAVS